MSPNRRNPLLKSSKGPQSLRSTKSSCPNPKASKGQSPRKPQKSASQNAQKKQSSGFTGFVAHFADGTSTKERENYFSKKQKKVCRTNWHEINKDNLVALELLWNGVSKVRLEKEEPTDSHRGRIEPSEWFFSQSGYMDLNVKQVIVVSRNIGYTKDGINQVTSVNEADGTIRIFNRAV